MFVEDKLFATLDPTTRRIDLPGGVPLLLTDTVGFVRKLPHRLIESFKATLEEALMADFLVHVLDASQPEVFTFHKTTMDVLAELGAKEKRVITVFNKIDLLGEDDTTLNMLRRHFPDALYHLHAHRGGSGCSARGHGGPTCRGHGTAGPRPARRPGRSAGQPAS